MNDHATDHALSLWALGCPPGSLAADGNVPPWVTGMGVYTLDARKSFVKLLIPVAPESEGELLTMMGTDTLYFAQALAIELVVHGFYMQVPQPPLPNK